MTEQWHTLSRTPSEQEQLKAELRAEAQRMAREEENRIYFGGHK